MSQLPKSKVADVARLVGEVAQAYKRIETAMLREVDNIQRGVAMIYERSDRGGK